MKLYLVVPFIVFAIGLCVIIPLGITQYNEYLQNENKLHEDYTKLYGNYIGTEIRSFIGYGEILQLAYTLFNFISRGVHEIIVREVLESEAGIQAMAIIHKINHDERLETEKSASDYFSGDIKIHDLAGNVVPESDVYYPITMTTPYKGNEPAILLDIATTPTFSVLERAIETGKNQVSLGFTLVQETGDQVGIVIFYPVYSGGPTAIYTNSTERINASAGATEIVFRMQDWLDIRMSNIIAHPVMVEIIDSRDNKLLAFVEGSTGTWTHTRKASNYPPKELNINVADATWIVRVSRTGQLSFTQPYLAFVVGLPTLLVVVIFISMAVFLVRKNIRQQKAMHTREVEINQTKQTFIHYIFHEIRVPFQTIKLGILNLKNYLVMDKSAKEIWRSIDNSINHAHVVLNDMLDIGKMENNKFKINPKPCLLPKTIKLTLDGFKMDADAKNINMIIDIDDRLNTKMVILDSNRIVQCISNFLSNALKFTPEGSITFSMKITSEMIAEYVTWNILISVKDTGIGISKQDQKKLFVPYEQIRNKSQEVGTGLGLVISKNIAELHGGSIGAESEEKVGSTFWLELPVKVIDIDPRLIDSTEEQEVDLPEELFLKSVLVVDDNKNNCFSFGEFLRNLGFNDISFANNGLEALKCLEEKKYDVVFMDLHMPKMDGCECVVEIRKRYSKDPIYIIMLTGAFMEVVELKNMGANDVLYKPLNIDNLKKSLNKFYSTRCKSVEEQYQCYKKSIDPNNFVNAKFSTNEDDLDNII